MTSKTDDAGVFHVKHPEDQEVVAAITRGVRTFARSRAARKGWETRKRMQAARERRRRDEGEGCA